MSQKTFPIMKSTLRSIPWEMIAPHQSRALKNHGQTLNRLAERGGLEPSEAIAILTDQPWPWAHFAMLRTDQEKTAWRLQKEAELERLVCEWLTEPTA